MSKEQNRARGRAERLQVRLLGAVEVTLDGKRLRAFDSLRLQRFLALLVLRLELGHRSRLAFELWPDSDERQARTNLRKLLHDFRQALPESEAFVDIATEVVRWIPDGPSTVDVGRFRAAVAAGDLELAAALYSGDLLPACYEDWILEEQRRLAEAHYQAIRELIALLERDGEWPRALDLARREVELDPLREEAHQDLMRLLAAAGAYWRSKV